MNDDVEPELTFRVTGTRDPAAPVGAWTMTMSGEVDLESAPRLIDAVDGLIAQGATLIVLDASGVEFMDSSGIRAIVQCGQRLRELGGRLLIEGMSGAVQRVLEISGLLDQYRA